jgi:hypothetical protein
LRTALDHRFELEAEIGSGGMGTVYRARDLQRGLPVAVKLLSTYKPADVERFARESQVLSELSHPGIVRYVAHGHVGAEQLYFVMEWVDGITLGEHLLEVGVDLAQSVQLTRAVADALSHAHQRGIIHRDLKPSNVMLADRDVTRPKLIDFGIARRLRDDEVKLTRTGAAMGTPGYMAPEQVRGSRDIDPRTDVFALGCLFYECLAGAAAFPGANWIAIQTKILIAQPPPIPDAPDDLAELIIAMLAKDPGQRPVDAGAVVRALDALGRIPSSPRRSQRHGASMPTQRAAVTWRFPAHRADLACFVIAVAEEAPPALDAFLEPFGGQLVQIDDGAFVVSFRPVPALEPTVVRAARCAFALRAISRSWPLAIVADDTAIDEVAREIAADEIALAVKHEQPGIRLDATMASLLEREFEVRRDRRGLLLAPR